jgi:hypothetical protein
MAKSEEGSESIKEFLDINPIPKTFDNNLFARVAMLEECASAGVSGAN